MSERERRDGVIEFTWAQVFEPDESARGRRWGAVGGGRALSRSLSRIHHTIGSRDSQAEVTPGRGRNWISWRWCMREIMALDRMGKCVSLTTHSPPPATRRGGGGGWRGRPRRGGGPRPPPNRPPLFPRSLDSFVFAARRVFPQIIPGTSQFMLIYQ